MSGKNQKKFDVPYGTLIQPMPNKLAPQRRRVSLDTGPESLTEQSHKDDCDINNIVKKVMKNGVIPQVAGAAYGDFSTEIDFQTAMNIIAKGNEQFSALDARTRERFGNSPAAFLEFATDGSNAEEMVRMGLMDPKAVERVREARKTQNTGSPTSDPDGKSGSATGKGKKED